MGIAGMSDLVVLWVAGVLAVLGTGGTLILLVLAWKQYRQAQRSEEF